MRTLKRRIDEIDGQFGLVMLHHSFEHLADPRRALERVRDLVDPGRYAIVRVPVVSWAWREYGVDWFQLDAPRHLFLFTERGFRDLAEASGFAVDHVAYDSTEFQFWVSEQYRSDIPLFDERSYFVNPEGGLFTARPDSELETARRQAQRRGRRRPGVLLPAPAMIHLAQPSVTCAGSIGVWRPMVRWPGPQQPADAR